MHQKAMSQKFISMREVKWQEYEAFLREHCEIIIEGAHIPLTGRKQVTALQPQDFQMEQTTVWSFPERGTWATHQGNYRGNWAPQIPRNLILRYTQPGELVLDQMVGGGTTLVECKLLGRNGIGVDINYDALMLTFDRLNFEPSNLYETLPPTEIRLYHGDARNLDQIPDGSVDLIATHPPYANIIAYSKGKVVDGDLSSLRSLDEYLDAMSDVAKECYRVLKPGRHCAILVGDTRRHKHYVPIALRVMERFLQVGFILREDVIKAQWKMKSTRERWQPIPNRDFLLIYHERLFIFRKPERDEDTRKFRDSMEKRRVYSSSPLPLSGAASTRSMTSCSSSSHSPIPERDCIVTVAVPSNSTQTIAFFRLTGNKVMTGSPFGASTCIGLSTTTDAFGLGIANLHPFSVKDNAELCIC